MTPYVHSHENSQANHATRTAASSAGFLLPHIDADTRILDIGCGPSSITCDLAEHILKQGGSSEQVYAVDNAAEAVMASKQLASQRGLNINIQQANTYQLPFADDTFDVVYAHQILYHLDDPLAAIYEWARVVRPGGLIASREADYGAMTWYPPNPGLSRWRAVFSVVLANNGGEPNAGRHVPTWFHQAGLSNLKVSSSTWTYGNEAERNWLADNWSARTTEDSYVRRAAEALGDAAPQDSAGSETAGGEVGATTRQAIDQIGLVGQTGRRLPAQCSSCHTSRSSRRCARAPSLGSKDTDGHANQSAPSAL